MILVLVGISAHPVWIGLIFSWLFGFKLGWTPIAGYCDLLYPSTDCGGPAQWAYHMILPWMTFAILFAALYVRMIRANVMETLERGLRAHGAGKGRTRVQGPHRARPAQRNAAGRDDARHGYRRSRSAARSSRSRSSAFPDSGRFAAQSLENFDLPVIMGIVVFSTLVIIVFNLFVDILYAFIDPRITARLDGLSRGPRTSVRASRPTTGSSAPSTASASRSSAARHSVSWASPAAARASRA